MNLSGITPSRCHRGSSVLRYRMFSLILVVLKLIHLTSAFYTSAITAKAAESRLARGGSGRGTVTRNVRNTWMARSLAASPKTKAEKRDEFFRSKEHMVEFGSSQHVEASIPGATLPSMQDYISDPSRIIYACWNHDDIQRMGEGIFRIGFKGQRFLSVSLDFYVDMEVHSRSDGIVHCKSVGYSVENMASLLGQEFVNTFFLELEGQLSVEESETNVRSLKLRTSLLVGDVEVTIGGKLPLLLAATPESLVKAAALGMNQRVLEYVSSAFVSAVARDYRQWARAPKPLP